MIFSVSNIAWNIEQEDNFYKILKDFKVKYIEVCPYKISNSWDISDNDITSFLRKLNDYNLKPYSLQSIFYNLEGNIIQNESLFINHFEKIIIPLCKKLKIKKIVFGSPKNRKKIQGLSDEQIEVLLVLFFRKIGDLIKKHKCNLYFCIEPNSKKYGSEFLTNTVECINLIKKINHNKIKLHIDTGNLILEKENGKNIKSIYTKHFHVSEPFLDSFNNPNILHKKFSKEFKLSNIESFTLEMVGIDEHKKSEDNLITALKFINDTYL